MTQKTVLFHFITVIPEVGGPGTVYLGSEETGGDLIIDNGGQQTAVSCYGYKGDSETGLGKLSK